MEKYGFVYIWYDRKHKRYYIGSHWGTINDGYICSSSWMKQAYKHRPQDFKRRVLKTNIFREDLINEEQKWLSLTKKEELGKRYYNLNNICIQHWHTSKQTRLSVGEKVSIAKKKYHETNPGTFTGKTHSKEAREKLRQKNLGKKLSEETVLKISESNLGDKNHFYGKEHSNETKTTISSKVKNLWKDPVYREIQKQSRSKVSQRYNTGNFCYNNGIVMKYFNPSNVPEGWTRGRI